MVLAAFGIFQMVLMKVVPGKTIHGPLTANAHTPVYTENGFSCYLITMALYLVGIFANLWNGGVFINYFGEVIIRLNMLALTLCFGLIYKGYYHPTTKDVKLSGDFFSDYFWGTDLYPKVFGIDVKVWTNCRMGMTMWPLIITSCLFF